MSTLAAKWENHTSIPHDLRRETSNYDPRVFYWKNQALNNPGLGGHSRTVSALNLTSLIAAPVYQTELRLRQDTHLAWPLCPARPDFLPLHLLPVASEVVPKTRSHTMLNPGHKAELLTMEWPWNTECWPPHPESLQPEAGPQSQVTLLQAEGHMLRTTALWTQAKISKFSWIPNTACNTRA